MVSMMSFVGVAVVYCGTAMFGGVLCGTYYFGHNVVWKDELIHNLYLYLRPEDKVHQPSLYTYA